MHANREQVFPASSLYEFVAYRAHGDFEKGNRRAFCPRGDRYTRDIVSVGVEIER